MIKTVEAILDKISDAGIIGFIVAFVIGFTLLVVGILYILMPIAVWRMRDEVIGLRKRADDAEKDRATLIKKLDALVEDADAIAHNMRHDKQ